MWVTMRASNKTSNKASNTKIGRPSKALIYTREFEQKFGTGALHPLQTFPVIPAIRYFVGLLKKLLFRNVQHSVQLVHQSRNDQIVSKSTTSGLQALSAHYFSGVRSLLPTADPDIATADKVFSLLHDLSRKNPSKRKCLDALTDARKLLVRLEGVNLAKPAIGSDMVATQVDDE